VPCPPPSGLQRRPAAVSREGCVSGTAVAATFTLDDPRSKVQERTPTPYGEEHATSHLQRDCFFGAGSTQKHRALTPEALLGAPRCDPKGMRHRAS
jgi:hypothetical protein